MQEKILDNKKIAKNTIFLYFRMLFLMAINLYASRVILEGLGVDNFGIYNVIGGLVVVFTFISNAMIASTQRYLNFSIGKNDKEKIRDIFNASQIIHIILAIIVVVSVETIGIWFLKHEMDIPVNRLDAAEWVLQFTVFTTAFLIISYPYNALIIAREKMNIFAYISIIEGIGKLIVAYLIFLSPIDKLIFYAFMLMIIQVSVSLGYRIYCIKKFPEVKFKIRGIGKALYKEIVLFSAWNIIGNIANVCLLQGTNILLNMFFGPAVNAAKGISMQVQRAVFSFTENFQTAQNPQIVKSFALGEKHYMQDLVYRASRLSFFLSLILGLPIILNVKFIVNLWLTVVPEYTYVFIQYTMAFAMIQSLATPLLTSAMATGNVKKLMSTIAVFFCMVIPICYIALKLGCSPVSVFQIMFVMYITAHVMRIRIVCYQLDFSIIGYLKSVIFPLIIVSLLSFGLCYMLTLFLPAHGFLANMLKIFSMLIITLVIVWRIGMSKTEREKISITISNKLKQKNDKRD